MSKRRFAALLAACFATAAAAQQAREWLGQAPLPGFVVGWEQQNRGAMIVEYVPRGETVHAWTRMITIQHFLGRLNGSMTFEAWVDNYLGNVGRACPGAVFSRPAYSRIQGRPAVQLRGDCPRNALTGSPETFLFLGFNSGGDLHIAQVAFRHVPSADELRWARRHLASVIFCTAASANPICRADPEPRKR